MAEQTPPPIDWSELLEALPMADPLRYRNELASLPLEPLDRPMPVVNPLIKPTEEAAMPTPLPPPVQRFNAAVNLKSTVNHTAVQGASTVFTYPTAPAPQLPTVGRGVHYVSYGTHVGESGKLCRAATVTAIPDQHPEVPAEHPQVRLAVLDPTGLFFHERVMLDEGDASSEPEPGMCDGKVHHVGTWHWPARV